jgi:GT2 family glycosyltransferase
MERTRSPRLSVITALYNCLEYSQAMVASLQASIPGGISYEVILVDDGSTDGTREWLATLKAPFRVLLNERNCGFGASNNRGAAVARGRVLALLNNDLVLKPGWLGPMLSALDGLGCLAGVVGNVQRSAATGKIDHSGILVDEKAKPVHDHSYPSFVSRLLWPEKRVLAATGACMLIRADTWRRLGGFDEAFVNGCEDVDLCLRAREAGLINVVALDSQALHHVSKSPGRKLRDEDNTRKLLLRWRHVFAASLALEPAKRLLREHIAEPRNFPETLEAIWMASYLARIHSVPPLRALEPGYFVIDLELARWREMFSD